jgi:integrase
MTLTWDEHGMRVELSSKYPMLSIPADCQKSNKDEMLPVAPEFAEMLLSVPDDQRTGFVFNPARKHSEERFKCPREAGRTIRLIGQRANVKVDEFTRKGETVIKYATAHDLRRAFGTRWAPRVMLVDLQKLMRHETIETTMKFYVNQNVDDISRRLYNSINDPAFNLIPANRP